ncbi:MAG: DUF4956 domain-containing protein [Caldilineaceae bacterium]|nr:DUF4956 domain-containing protein [Caldilineaceae bacterium]
MINWIDLLESMNVPTGEFSINDIVLTIVLSFLLSLVVGWTYQKTHRSPAYTQSYVHTLVMMSMVVAIIMLIIGSNIARAFTLVGALSIVRFRNAVKDTRDVGYIFFAMVVGMACGTRFYLLGAIATVTICFFLWVMLKLNLFAQPATHHLLKVRLAADLPYATLFETVFHRFLKQWDLIAMETVQAGTLTELVYTVEMQPQADLQAFLAELSRVNGNNKVMLISGQQEVDL